MITIHSLIDSFGAGGLQVLALLGVWATVLLALAWLIARLLRGASAAARYIVWQFALTGLLVLPLLYALLPGAPLGFSLPPKPAAAPNDGSAFLTQSESAANARPPGLANRDSVEEALLPSVRAERMRQAGEKPAHAKRAETKGNPALAEPSAATPLVAIPSLEESPARDTWPALLAGLWAIGALVQLAWVALCAVRARRLVRSAEPLRDGRPRQILDDLMCRLSIRRRVELLQSSRTTIPVVLGILRPKILLPADCADWSAERTEIVLSHELAHIRRRDVFWQLVARLAAALYWFHPLAWLAVSRMKAERERACDDLVLSAGVQPEDYAAGLLEVAASLSGMQVRLLGGIGMAERGQLESRLRSILDASLLRRPPSRRARHGLLLGGACIVAGLAMLRPFSPIPAATADAPEPAKKADSEKQPAEGKGAADAATDSKRNPDLRTMRIKVLGPDGRPVEAAYVHSGIWSRPRFTGKRDYSTDANGEAVVEFPQAVNLLRIWTRIDGHVPLWGQWWPEKFGHSIPEQFTFRLQKGTAIGGLVKNERGEPIEGATVEVQLVSRGMSAEPGARPDVWLAEDDSARKTDKQGRWTLDNVPGGDVELLVKLSHPDYTDDQNWGGLQREQSVTTKDLRKQSATIVMKGGVTVTGKVTDPAGKPVAGAVVIWGDEPYMQWGSQEVRTNEEGVYRFPPLPSGPMTVTVVAKGWMPELKKVEIQPDIGPVDFQLKPGKTLRIRFVDGTGAPVPEVSVSIDRWRGGESLYNTRHQNVLDTKIPRRADKDGVYEWNWAPDDAVKYRFNKPGYARAEADMTADGSEHVYTLKPLLRIAGRVTDAVTGRPINRFTAIPVLEFRPTLLHAERGDAKPFSGGEYSLELDRTDVAHRVRIEADGYRSAMGDAHRVGDSNAKSDVRLEPAPPTRGRVLNTDGAPVAGAKVYLATRSQTLSFHEYEDDSYDNQRTVTDEKGAFQFPAQFERYAIIVIDENGYAEIARPPEQQPGEITLRKWASVEGVLFQAGQPVPSADVTLYPVRLRDGALPHIQDGFSTRTDEDGRFTFPRVPPTKCALKARLSVFEDFPITSSESVPLQPKPGERMTVNLGGDGAQVTGRVALAGEAAGKIDLHYSLNHLLRLAPGIEPPAEVQAKGFDWRRGWSDSWMSTLEGIAYRRTLHHYFVKLGRDGSFHVSGVPAGDYELNFKVYEPPEKGCLVSPVGSKTVRFRVTDADVEKPSLDLGRIEIEAALGPRPGEAVPDFQFETADGEKMKLSDLRGRRVLIDFWATWCGPCVSGLPALGKLYDEHHAAGRLLVLGMNLDADKEKARQFVRQRKLPWLQGFVGDWSEKQLPTRLGVNTIPAYLLIGPDGKLIQKCYSIEDVKEKLATILTPEP